MISLRIKVEIYLRDVDHPDGRELVYKVNSNLGQVDSAKLDKYILDVIVADADLKADCPAEYVIFINKVEHYCYWIDEAKEYVLMPYKK